MLYQRKQCRQDSLFLFVFYFICMFDLQNHQITHVVNVSITGDRASFLDENDDEHFLRIPINDCLNAQLLPYFEQAYMFIGKYPNAIRKVRVI